MFKRGFPVVAAAAAVVCGLSMQSSAALFSDNFDTGASAANYNVFSTTTGAGGTGSPTGLATFAYDYSALGIPSAPNSSGGSTIGLRVQSDNSVASNADNVLGSVSVATKSLNLPSVYTVQVDVWGNYVGGTTINDAGGTNGTTGATIATQTAGTTYNSALTNNNDGFLTDAIRDPSAGGGTYRLYTNGVNHGNTDGKFSMYAASGGLDTATTAQMYTNAYYTSMFPAKTAPTVQSTAASTQTGSTQAGEFGFAWHTVTISNDGTNTVWSIDGSPIATAADSSYVSGGNQISLGDQDGNLTPSTVAGQVYNFDVFDNLVVTPEPASLGLLAMAAIPLFRRRRNA